MIDRRVQILNDASGRPAATTLSALRDRSFVVLLGEPGIGKTTVLDAEAVACGTQAVKVRELINGTVETSRETLYLDALDEYRVGATDFDKVHQLAKAIRASGATRWWLTCRSEDWQKDADIEAIRRTTNGRVITVAQLLPLDINEASAVLAALGESDPDAFVARAYAMGAAGLLESPLSLKLLRQSIIGDRPWPTNRFALFDQATHALAHEDNKVHRLDRDRSSAEAIVSAAARASLFLLSTGSRFLWRSGALPPTGDVRAYLPASALELNTRQIDDALGSSLFRGEGEAFEPVHRTIAEFLGGRALAEAVIGGAQAAALPFGRAKALIAGADGRAPTDLRGLYAWFAAHLAVLGAKSGAHELIEADAVSVLVYGDAAVFDTQAKRAILSNLDRHDPYFRASEVGVTAVGGLASEDLADDLRAVLEQGDGTHRMLTVYEVLTAGPPVMSLRPLLRSIALEPRRPEWQRTRAVDAWLNGQADADTARRELFDALGTETPSALREALRAELIAGMSPHRVDVTDIKSVLRDFVVAPDDSTVMRLFGFRQALTANPRPELFDEPFDWLPVEPSRRHSVDVEDLIDHALAAAIRVTQDLSAARLWRWLVHTREDKWSNLGEASRPAVQEWLDVRAGRDVELFEAVLASDDPAEGPWMIGTYYFMVARAPDGVVLDRLIESAANAKGMERRRLLAIAVNIARRYEVGPDAYWRLHAFLEAMPRGNKRLLRELTVAEIERWRRQQYRYARRRSRADEKRLESQRRTLRRLIPAMARGANTAALAWAAETYFHPKDKKGEAQSRLERLAAETDPETLDAILMGWRHLATHDTPGVDPSTLGEIEVKGGHFYSEYAAIAGLDRLRTEALPVDPTTLPLTLAIILLRSGWITHGSGVQDDLEKWAWLRLNADPVAGAGALHTFWEAVLVGGGTNSTTWHHAADEAGGRALAIATEALLEQHPAMSPDVLRTLLAAGGKHVDRATLVRLAALALADPIVSGKQRAMWSIAAFALDPLNQRGSLAGHLDRDLLELFDGVYGTGLVDSFPAGSDAERAALAAGLFAVVAPYAEAHVERRSGPVLQSHRLSDAGNAMLKRLAATPDPSATEAIKALRQNLSAYPAWEAALRHAAEQQARARRDREHLPPSASAVAGALAGRDPVNAADLRAILVDELRRYGRELRTGSTSPWRDYWNTDSSGRATTPKVENIARDITLTRLQERLTKYRIAIALPEGQRRDDTRADILLVSGAGRNLPVEAKRHYHADLWTAAAGQLQGYASDERADGFGILLVFWFGDVAAAPPRSDGAVPTTAAELEALLVSDLPADLRERTDVIVLDVSAPERAGGSRKAARAGEAQPVKGTSSTARNSRTSGKRAPAKREGPTT